MQFLKNLYIPLRFFYVGGALVILFAASFPLHHLFPFVQAAAALLLTLTIVDCFILFNRSVVVSCNRITAKVLSLDSENTIALLLLNKAPFKLFIKIYDELPFQFQQRDLAFELNLNSLEKKRLEYKLVPKSRGEYAFGNVNIYVRSLLGLVERRLTSSNQQLVAVYPSIIQMKQLEIKSLSRISMQQGIKKIRKLGHGYEFEQIKNYVPGDDYRSINWKATGRKSSLMVNQFEDERSQQIFCILDNSRAMKMPFNNLSLFDYAINTSLIIANTALHKYDKIGLISFSDKLETFVKPDKGPGQLKVILNALYHQHEKKLEANYELLYTTIRKRISQRSLLFLFTNFESVFTLERSLPTLRKINKQHLLVLVFFENSEISDFAKQPAKRVDQIYNQVVAEKFVMEKAQAIHQLKQLGIHAILTRPEDLSVNAINKYLELKARGMI